MLVSTLVKQRPCHLVVAFLGGDVKRRVQVEGGAVRRGAVLQQQHHVVNVAKTRGNVKRTLVFLQSQCSAFLHTICNYVVQNDILLIQFVEVTNLHVMLYNWLLFYLDYCKCLLTGT